MFTRIKTLLGQTPWEDGLHVERSWEGGWDEDFDEEHLIQWYEGTE